MEIKEALKGRSKARTRVETKYYNSKKKKKKAFLKYSRFEKYILKEHALYLKMKNKPYSSKTPEYKRKREKKNPLCL